MEEKNQRHYFLPSNRFSNTKKPQFTKSIFYGIQFVGLVLHISRCIKMLKTVLALGRLVTILGRSWTICSALPKRGRRDEMGILYYCKHLQRINFSIKLCLYYSIVKQEGNNYLCKFGVWKLDGLLFE
uniref:Uncharacterized protein n=1 Tax=Romanomermis culicivorax TaxID=13658 RepID=A0A915HLQ5_ROMCU